MRGRKPLPTATKILQGTFRKHRANGDEPQPTRALLRPPRGLPPEALAEWKRVAPELDAAGVSTVLDRGMLIGYVLNYAHAVQAEALIAKHGLTVENASGGQSPNPAIRIARSSWDLVAKFAADFGFTPASRTRIKVLPQAPARPNPFAMLRARPDA